MRSQRSSQLHKEGMLRLLAELNEERIRHHGGVEPKGGRPKGGRWRRRRVVWLWRRRVRNSYVSRETAAAAPDGSLASSMSLWHSSRYKTLILTIEPLGAFQRQLQPRHSEGPRVGRWHTAQVWRGVCATHRPIQLATRLGRGCVRGGSSPEGLFERFILLSCDGVPACVYTPPLALHSLTQEHLLPSTSPPTSPDASPQASDSF